MFDEKYEILQLIGRGGSCTVYLAEHKRLHKKCVIKCIPGEEEKSNIILREAEVLKNLNYLYAPVLYDYAENAQVCYLVEEYIDGQSIHHLGKCQHMISQNRLMELAIKICEAVKWLHERKPYPVLYLDLKPEHIVLSGDRVKLVDFGSAVYLRGEKISGMITGTKGFASPEQERGKGVDERSDIYSIGAVLYWLMTKRIIVSDDDYQVVGYYTKAWNNIVKRCLEQEMGKRYGSVRELMTDLLQLQRSEPKGQLRESYVIAVTGCQNRVGTTHFSIGLCIACDKLGIDCLYEEKNDSGAVQEMFRHCRGVYEKKGIYYLPGFKASPRYGQAICEELSTSRIMVRDYGRFEPGRLDEYAKADCILVIAGGKEWEIQQTRELIERYRKRRDMHVVLRTSGSEDFRRIQKECGVQSMFLMPEYRQPFSIRKRELDFYKTLLERITSCPIRRLKGAEKKRTQKVHHNHWCGGSR